MKKIIVLALLICGICDAYSQDCYDKVAKQAVVIDSLQKDIIMAKAYNHNITTTYQSILKNLRDTINVLKQDLTNLEKFKSQKKTIDAQLKTKSDSIILLKTQLVTNNKLIETTKQQGDQKAQQEKEQGKLEALANVINSYKNIQFDDLIKSSTKESVQRDMQLVVNYTEVKPILTDLVIYFIAQELLSKKFDSVQIKKTYTLLSQMKRQSKLTDILKDNLTSYQNFNTALKETIGKIVSLDSRKSADGDSQIQKLKFNEIVTILTDYMYNYYDYTKYPHLADIFLEIIKRKKLNADDKVVDLLQKL